MSMIIHVVKPTGGRFELSFPDDTPDEKILQQLETIKDTFGFNGTVRKVDTDAPVNVVTDFGDPDSGFAYDNPKTQVVVLKTDARGQVQMDDKKKPVVLKHLKGSPEPDKPAPKPAKE